MRTRRWVILLLAAASCDDGAGAADLARDAAEAADAAVDLAFIEPDAEVFGDPCNGRPWLCDRRYDEITHIATHGAVTSSDPLWDGWRAQHENTRAQLDQGIRALMLETFPAASGPLACLYDCARGSRPLATPLSQIKAFFDVNPREVVTLLVENHAPVAELSAALAAAGLDTLAHAQPAGAPWPTLAQMIASQKRLVIFARDAGAGGPRPEWVLAFDDFVRETARAPATVQELVTCALEPGPARPFLLVHHYVVVSGVDADGGLSLAPALEAAAASANAQAVVSSTFSHCGEQGLTPSFVAVDFFEIGDVRNFVTLLADQ